MIQSPTHRPTPAHRFRTAAGWLLAALCVLPLLANGCAGPSARGGAAPMEEERPEEAEARCRAAIARNPNDAEAHFRLAHVLAERGRTAEAATHYDRAAALDRDYGARGAEDRRRIVRELVAESRTLLAAWGRDAMESPIPGGGADEAEILLNRATDLVPANQEIRFLQGRLRERRGDIPGAVAAYRAALELEPGHRETQQALAGALGDLGRERYDAGRFRDAQELVEEALALDPQPDLNYLLGTIAYALAQQSQGEVRKEHLDRAARAFRQVLREDDDDDDARFNLGAVLLASEQFEAAAEVYLELIARNPEQGDLYMALARAHSLVGELSLTATEEAIGRALRVGEPVEDPSRWARLAAERFPHSELAATYFDLMVPDAIRTYTIPGGALVEVWFYRRESVVEVFRDGGRVGPAFHLPRR